MPKVLAAHIAMIEIVMAAPPMLIVAPSGIDTEYDSSSKPSFSQSARFIGMFAALERVKNAVIYDSLMVLHKSG